MQRLLGLLGQMPFVAKIIPGFVVVLIIVSLLYMRFGHRIGNIVVIGLLIIILLLLGLNLIIKWRQKKKEASFDHALQKRSEEQSVSRVEVQRARAELAQRWNAAVSEFKKSNMTLYSLPWYMLVGEPQSGKTTTLISSEIEFPVGTECLSGVGGTRNCDWFFTNEAVILDTAGRFTFQEKNAPDHEEWKSFLNLLKNHRTNCPINGVIVVVPATSLLEDSPEEREQKAKNIRQKLIHIQDVLEVRFPVFILITKCDRILGFTEFFSRLGAAQQRQLFGWSNQASFEQSYNPDEGFTEVFKKLYNEMHRWRLKFIGEGINLSQIDKLFVFPEEFQALQKPFQEYLNAIFIQDRFHEPLFFRGFYFTSGLQQGRPVAKACRELLGGEGVDNQIIENLEQVFQKSRAFFIRDFYKKKVFPEQELVIRSAKAQKRDSLIQYIVWAGGGTIAVLSLALLIWGVVTFKRDISPALSIVVEAKEILQQKKSLPLAESFKTVHALSEQRQRILKSNVSAVFFKGRENVVTEDLKKIHQLIFIKECLYPLLQVTQKRLVEINWDVSSPHFKEYYAALKEYILWWSISADPESVDKKHLSNLSIIPFIEFCSVTTETMSSYNSEKIDEWLTKKSFLKHKLEEEFSYFVREEKGDPSKALSKGARREVIEPALGNLENYWELSRIEGIGWWFTLIEIAKKTDESYKEILLLSHEDSSGSIRELIQDFLKKYEIFDTGMKEISEHLKQDIPAYQRNVDTSFKKIQQKCASKYDSLIPPGISDTMLKEEITGQKERVLKQIEEEYQSFVRESVYEYPHIIEVHGGEDEKAATAAVALKKLKKKPGILSTSLSTETKPIIDFLKELYAFVNIYPSGEESNEFQEDLEELKQHIKDNPIEAATYLQQWHDQQISKRDELMNAMNELEKLEFHENWNIRELEMVVKKLIYLAEQERVSSSVDSSPGGKQAAGPKKGGGKAAGGPASPAQKEVYTFVALRKTLSEQSAMLNVFKSNPKAYNQLLRKELQYVYNYLNFWYQTYSSFNPGQSLMAANDWYTFQSRASSLRDPLLDFDKKPLKGLFENVPYQEVQNLIYATPEIAADADISAALSRFKTISRAYQNGTLDSLGSACDEFIEDIKSLGPSPVKAWEKVSKDGLTPIGKFKKAHRELKDELIMTRLMRIEDRAIFLLKKGLKKDVIKKVDIPEEMDVSGVPMKFTLEFCKITVSEMSPVAAIQYLQEYVRYWQNVYKGFSPGKKIMGSTNWSEFQYNISAMKLPLANFAPDSPVGLLLKHMNYKKIHDIIDSVAGAKTDPVLKSEIKELEKLLIGYQSPDTIAALQEAENKFIKSISSLDESPIVAWNQLAAGEVGVDDVKAFSRFERYNKGLEDELVLNQLEKIEECGLRLLRHNVENGFMIEWNKLMGKYRERLADRFPFKQFAPIYSGVTEFGFEVPYVEFSDLREFFLGSDGLKDLMDKFNLQTLLTSKNNQLGFPGDKIHKEFIIRCMNLKQFLFEGSEERSHKLEIWFSSTNKAPKVGQRFTCCRLTAPGGIRLTIRESSQSKQQVWKPGQDENRLRIEGINEQTHQKGLTEIQGGPLSFLAFVTMGKQKSGWGNERWIVPVQLPDPEVEAGAVYGIFDVKFEMPVPVLPNGLP